MPLVANSGLPAFERLRRAGQNVLDADRALHQDIRELHIGLLNMMPDTALEATERQFLRLLGASNRIVQIYVHLFSVPGITRQGTARAHIERYYEDFDQLQADGLDALVITGANPAQPVLSDEGFWDDLIAVFDWAAQNVCSTLCSCLATHAHVQRLHGIARFKLPRKRWGVYSHQVVAATHPLVNNVNTRFDTPQSHVYEVARAQFDAAGLPVLADSAASCVHLATSPDGFRFVYFQGHPEYDINSLLKEYKREVSRFLNGQRDDYPPLPDHYFTPAAIALLEPYQAHALTHRTAATFAAFPEQRLEALIDNTWTDTGKAMFNNWLGLVYQITDRDRRIPYMADVDRNNPLGLGRN